jgi:hypothetical protein
MPAPSTLTNEPAAQVKQLVDPVVLVENRPAAQAAQAVAPLDGWYWPCWHGRQLVELAWSALAGM